MNRASDEAKFNAAAFNFLLLQVVVAAGVIGRHFGSWWWFGGVFLGLAALVSMPGFRLVGALALGLAGSAAISMIASRYFSTTVSIVIGVIAFAFLGTFNAAAAQHQDDLDAVDALGRRVERPDDRMNKQ